MSLGEFLADRLPTVVLTLLAAAFGFALLVTLGEETYSAGTLETAEVTALENEQTIFTLPSARYVQGEVAP